MRTIALRYAENFAPECGTIKAHQQKIDDLGFVWYGKFGSAVAREVAEAVLKEDDPVILLIHSGSTERYWAHVSEITREVPQLDGIPSYYRSMAGKVGCWFRVVAFERAAINVMSKCEVASSKKSLSTASRCSMSPYFIIDYDAK